MNAAEIIRRHADKLTYRQLDSWTRQGYINPDNRGETGTGSRRDYDFREVEVIERMVALVASGVIAKTASEIARNNPEAHAALTKALEMCTNE